MNAAEWLKNLKPFIGARGLPPAPRESHPLPITNPKVLCFQSPDFPSRWPQTCTCAIEGLRRLLSDTEVKSRDEMAREILSYFLRNPDAADSFDGIARWRLLEDIVRRSVAATEEGLKWLIQQGYLKQESVPGGKPVFSLNSEMRKEAELFVAEQGSPKARESDE